MNISYRIHNLNSDISSLSQWKFVKFRSEHKLSEITPGPKFCDHDCNIPSNTVPQQLRDSGIRLQHFQVFKPLSYPKKIELKNKYSSPKHVYLKVTFTFWSNLWDVNFRIFTYQRFATMSACPALFLQRLPVTPPTLLLRNFFLDHCPRQREWAEFFLQSRRNQAMDGNFASN